MIVGDFVDEQLRLTALRVAEAVAHGESPLSREEERAWLARCAEREELAAQLSCAEHWPLNRLALTPTESRVLWILIAQELDPATRMNLRELATEDEVDVSHDVLRRVVYGHRPEMSCWSELSPSGSLLSACLIDALDDSATPEHRVAFRIARRVLAFVHGDRAIDPDLTGYVAMPTSEAHATNLMVDEDVQGRVQTAISLGADALTIVTGADGTGRRSLLMACARRSGHEVIAVDARELSVKLEVCGRQLRVLERESRIWNRIPLLLNIEALAATEENPDRISVVDRIFYEHLVLATARRPIARRWARTPIVIELPPLTGAQRTVLWGRVLPEASDGDAELLATLYPLAPALITSVAVVAQAEARGEALTPRHISLGLRHVLDDRLAGLATRLTITQEWNDLVLPEDQTLAVIELLARIRTRRRVYEDWGFARKLGKGLGVAALFSGPPGTGKTMCAGLIAKDLGTELYQVDLGKIVSKWVGETEKNLAALFDAAEASHAVLLFDEADSLFGKRTGVTSSNDRYANQETNFLLQRIESFAGICILTTNHDTAIDEAFLRRLAVRVRFPLPDEEERERLWRAMIPSDAPTDPTLDLGSLAKKYVMAGGNIRNAVLRAAFLAADANESIGNYHLRQAAQLEYEGMGKLASKN